MSQTLIDRAGADAVFAGGSGFVHHTPTGGGAPTPVTREQCRAVYDADPKAELYHRPILSRQGRHIVRVGAEEWYEFEIRTGPVKEKKQPPKSASAPPKVGGDKIAIPAPVHPVTPPDAEQVPKPRPVADRGLDVYRAIHDWDGSLALAVAGSSPGMPVGADVEGMKKWAKETVARGKAERKTLYAPSALRGWLRHGTPGGYEAGEKAVSVLNEAMRQLGWVV